MAAELISRAAPLEPLAPSKDLASRIRARFAGLDDVTLNVRQREPVRRPPISQFDAQIAAIALIHRLGVATCDVSGFEGGGLTVTDPWDRA
jgi:toxin FitB